MKFLTSRSRQYFACAVISFIIGGILFFILTWPPRVEAPKGPICIGMGPYPEAEINKTEVVVSIPENYIDVKVTFKFNESRKYFVYALLPFVISDAEPFAIHEYIIYDESVSEIGDLSRNFMNSKMGSSIANATFDPNMTCPYWGFHPPDFKEELTLGIRFKVKSNLVAVTDLLTSRQTIILTLFGNVMGIFEKDMNAYMGPNSRQTLDWSFIVSIQLPSDTYLSETYPAPIEYYVREEHRWVMFSMDFLNGRYAQTISCSFHNPTTLAIKEILVFLGGVAVAIGGSFLVEAVKYNIQRRKKWFTVKSLKVRSLTIWFVILQSIDAIQTALVFPSGEGNIIWVWIVRNFGYWAWLFFPLKAVIVFAVAFLTLRSDLIDRTLMKRLLLILNVLSLILVIWNFIALAILNVS